MAKRRRPDLKTEQPILENEQVRELLALLKEKNSPGYIEFNQLIVQVSEMEQQLSEALNELKVIRQEMQEVQPSALKVVLQKGYKSLEGNVVALHRRLSDLKEQIVDRCRNILTDFKERGTAALNGITQFLHLKPALEAVAVAAQSSIQACDQTIFRIDAFSAEYHQVGHHLKNMGKSLLGKPVETAAKENGKVAGMIKVIVMTERSCISAMKGCIEKMLSNLAKLEQGAQQRTSVIKTLREQAAKPELPKEKTVPVKVQAER